ncbi:SH3 domain-containing protein [Heyndrickxia sporothermodurans]|uniref:SH3 domain-containing protein n=1 Tax=Heyndrickxia sporothermodurans TaxID=46224 RepID=UPI002DB917AC|nr:SH3 domain-containing protein [Heyndrickxia sporothermodurans]MEB6550180.1 SH3 domain-containing protein [Heyndrickxia sporothermodurans]
MKKIFKGVLIAAASFSLVLPSFVHAAEPSKAKCQMTIESAKHTKDKPAQANNECKELIFGYYSKNVNDFKIFGIANHDVERNGQKFVIPVFSDKFVEAELTVYTKMAISNKPKPVKVLYKVRVTKNKSAIHTSNSGKSKTIKKLNTNDVVEVVQSKGSWYKVKNGKGYAWIYNKYVSKNLAPQVLYKVRVTKNKSAIHTSNSGKSKTIKKLNTNDVVEVVQSKGSWYKVKNGKGYAWIYNKYVSKNLTPKVLYKGKVTTKSLVIRSSNTTKSKKIGTLKKNAKVQIVQSKSGWYKIKKGKGYGWVSSKYVKK